MIPSVKDSKIARAYVKFFDSQDENGYLTTPDGEIRFNWDQFRAISGRGEYPTFYKPAKYFKRTLVGGDRMICEYMVDEETSNNVLIAWSFWNYYVGALEKTKNNPIFRVLEQQIQGVFHNAGDKVLWTGKDLYDLSNTYPRNSKDPLASTNDSDYVFERKDGKEGWKPCSDPRKLFVRELTLLEAKVFFECFTSKEKMPILFSTDGDSPEKLNYLRGCSTENGAEIIFLSPGADQPWKRRTVSYAVTSESKLAVFADIYQDLRQKSEALVDKVTAFIDEDNLCILSISAQSKKEVFDKVEEIFWVANKNLVREIDSLNKKDFDQMLMAAASIYWSPKNIEAAVLTGSR